RGESVEIGGAFRVPDVLAQSGARLVDVGTTNRTRLADYRQAIVRPGNDVALVLKVHPSNFRLDGFVETTPVAQLAAPVLDAVMEANGLSFSCHEVEANPYMPQDSSDLRHWLCSVSGGSLDGFEFYVSFGEEAGLPSAASALALVLEDVRSYRECRGYADFARLIGVGEDDPD
ncbi:hypothetical protein B4Q13_24490, partial [Lacticaseibacillus rhamnosus]